jgi:hypothetical protein
VRYNFLKEPKLNFSKRFPSLAQLAPVYAVIVVVIYSWSLLRFFWRLPSLLNYSTAADVGVILSYLITVNLFESLFVIALPVILSLILPQKWFFEHFVTRSLLLVLFGLSYMIYIANHINTEEPFPYTLFQWAPLVFLVILALVIQLGRVNFLQRMLEDLADRFEIFLFISIPISVISFIVVLVRNIL